MPEHRPKSSRVINLTTRWRGVCNPLLTTTDSSSLIVMTSGWEDSAVRSETSSSPVRSIMSSPVRSMISSLVKSMTSTAVRSMTSSAVEKEYQSQDHRLQRNYMGWHFRTFRGWIHWDFGLLFSGTCPTFHPSFALNSSQGPLPALPSQGETLEKEQLSSSKILLDDNSLWQVHTNRWIIS